MQTLVTGAAGFIGSHTVERLLDEGHAVIGVDSFDPYYDTLVKTENLAAVMSHPNFTFVHLDLASESPQLGELVAQADAVVHLAGQPGVRDSWGDVFSRYMRNNVLATKNLLDAAKAAGVVRFVYASSSSVYGELQGGAAKESRLPRPSSPYGITKLAAEHLCLAYAESFSLPVVALRYFSVYGPRQRPDMAFSKISSAVLEGTPFQVFGSGDHIRDFTFVEDVVDANHRALVRDDLPSGFVCNVAGGSVASMADVLATVHGLYPERFRFEYSGRIVGDVQRTEADTTLARERLGWRPRVDLFEGLRRQLDWQLEDLDQRSA